MGKMTITGLEEFESQLKALGDQSTTVIHAALYAGAGKLLEEVKKSIQALPEDEGYKQPGELRKVCTHAEKQALLTHIGIAKHDPDTTAIGFDGYTDYVTKKYPRGVPVPLIARSIESGSSVRQKWPFLRKTGNAAKETIQKAMADAATEAAQKITGGK